MAFTEDLYSMMDDLVSDRGEEITISDGAYSVEVSAMVGRQNRQSEDGNGSFVNSETSTFLMAAADLVFNGIAIEPRPGLRIERGTKVYQVQPPTIAEQCFNWIGPNRDMLRIFAVQIG